MGLRGFLGVGWGGVTRRFRVKRAVWEAHSLAFAGDFGGEGALEGDDQGVEEEG